MKKILSLFVILFGMSAFADLPDIVALVNDKPITKYDFESRKNMLVTLNNIDVSDHLMEIKLNNDILSTLIDEELLNQQSQKVGATVTRMELDEAILSIEQKNNMSENGLALYLKNKGVDIETFRKQILGELIKQNIINSLSQSVVISQNELDTALVNRTEKDFDIEAWIFTSKQNSDKALDQMKLLKKRLSSCNKVDNKLYEEFADAEKFDRKLKLLPGNIQSIIVDTKVDDLSSVYKDGDKFKLVFVCKKDRDISNNDLIQVENFLSNKKMSKKIMKFFKDLRAKAYIKTMISG